MLCQQCGNRSDDPGASAEVYWTATWTDSEFMDTGAAS